MRSDDRLSGVEAQWARDFSSSYQRLWRRTVRNLLLGTLISILPALVFYSVAFSYTPRQIYILLKILPAPLLGILAVDVWLNRWYLSPFRRFTGEDSASQEFAGVYSRLHNLPLFSFVRVFGPHAIAASVIAQLAVIYANRYLDFGVPSGDYGIYWLLNLTLVPIGHAVFEYHANGWAARDVLRALVAASPRTRELPGVRRVGLATRLAVFYTLLAVSPLLLLAAAVRLRALRAAFTSLGWSEIGMVIAGVTALNLLLLLLFAADVNQQTHTLLGSLQQVEGGDLSVQVDLFSPDEFGVISDGVNKMIRGLRDRQRVRDLFGIYLSPEVSRAILDGRVALEGETREVSVLFTDIRDFTRFSASRTPQDVVRRLNQFFSRMAEAIDAHGGTINKFLGDGFLAVFGAPSDQTDHARRAVEAALQMEMALQALNADLRAGGQPEVEIGIGIDTGKVIAGNVGSPNRLEYTVIGDPVNRSSRIEQLNKTLGTRILVSERTRRSSGRKDGRAFPPVAVKGIEEPLEVFTIGAEA